MLRALVSWELVGSPMSCALVGLSQSPLAPSSISSALVVGGVRLMNFGDLSEDQHRPIYATTLAKRACEIIGRYTRHQCIEDGINGGYE